MFIFVIWPTEREREKGDLMANHKWGQILYSHFKVSNLGGFLSHQLHSN